MLQDKRRLTLHTVVAALPPQLDGIGDYTANLTQELAKFARVKALAGMETPPAPIPGVEIQSVFSAQKPYSVWQIAQSVLEQKPDWVLLQYNPFSFGRWGLNLHLPKVMRAIRRKTPGTHFALMVHEQFAMPISNWKVALMNLWQRWQLWMLGRAANIVFCSMEQYAHTSQAWFPGKPVIHLPVGSNIQRVAISREEARRRLGLSERTAVLGLFGTAHISRSLALVRQAATAVRRSGQETTVIYIGPDAPVLQAALGDISLIADGPLPAEEVSRRFAAFDVYLAPFLDGISTRRTSLMTGLQHGSAVVGTVGAATDRMLLAERERAFLLAEVGATEAFCALTLRVLQDAALRNTLKCGAERLYCTAFDWPPIAARLLSALETYQA